MYSFYFLISSIPIFFFSSSYRFPYQWPSLFNSNSIDFQKVRLIFNWLDFFYYPRWLCFLSIFWPSKSRWDMPSLVIVFVLSPSSYGDRVSFTFINNNFPVPWSVRFLFCEQFETHYFIILELKSWTNFLTGINKTMWLRRDTNPSIIV